MLISLLDSAVALTCSLALRELIAVVTGDFLCVHRAVYPEQLLADRQQVSVHVWHLTEFRCAVLANYWLSCV